MFQYMCIYCCFNRCTIVRTCTLCLITLAAISSTKHKLFSTRSDLHFAFSKQNKILHCLLHVYKYMCNTVREEWSKITLPKFFTKELYNTSLVPTTHTKKIYIIWIKNYQRYKLKRHEESDSNSHWGGLFRVHQILCDPIMAAVDPITSILWISFLGICSCFCRFLKPCMWGRPREPISRVTRKLLYPSWSRSRYLSSFLCCAASNPVSKGIVISSRVETC